MNDELIDICHALNDDLRKLAQASVTLGKVLYSNVSEMSSVTSSMMNHLERFITSNPAGKSTFDSAISDCHTPSSTLPRSDIRVKQLFPENKNNAPPTANIPNTENKPETNSTKLLLSMKTKLNDQMFVRNNVHRRKPAAKNIIRKLVSLKPNALQTNLLKKPDTKSYMNAMVRCKYCPQMLALTH
uniref:Uncharacterized protein n=1 Tax=Romanomermis culicivorax TaxID=13658 RepID=A0A915K6K6_ROMCU